MARVYVSSVINGRSDRVWAGVREFNGHERWHPAVAKSAIERGQSADKLGCVRRFVLRDGALVEDAVGTGRYLPRRLPSARTLS